jgi:hypothetical protein
VQSVQSLQFRLSAVSLRSLQYVEAADLTTDDLNAMVQILRVAGIATERMDTEAWMRNVGRNNSFYSGWRLMLTRFFKILVDRGGQLSLPPKSGLEEIHNKLRLAHAAGQALHKSPVPRTLRDYAASCQSLQPLLAKLHPPTLNPTSDYSIPWIIRSHAIAEWRARGIDRCEVPADFPIKDFVGCFPDMEGWVTKLAQTHKIILLKKLLTLLDYSHPIELLTMYFCIFGETSLLDIHAEFLWRHAAALKALRQKLTQSTKVVPHPAVLLSVFRKELAEKVEMPLRSARCAHSFKGHAVKKLAMKAVAKGFRRARK